MIPALATTWTRLCVALPIAALACLFAAGGATAEGIVVRDARDRDVRIDDPSRIVSIGGAVT